MKKSMHLVVKNNNKSFKFPDDGLMVVGNSSDCVVQINHPEIVGKHFAISLHSYGNILEVYDHPVLLNNVLIHEKVILEAGDVISVNDLGFHLINDEYIPVDSKVNHTHIKINTDKNLSSVYGLRGFAPKQNGEFIIDDFHHEDGWHVVRKNEELHFMDSKNITLLNGLKIAQAVLANGDVIANNNYKYKVELPGTSGFSKFSPSHPRNVLLSESITDANENPHHQEGKPINFLKSNLWWITLILGLGSLALLVIKNPPA